MAEMRGRTIKQPCWVCGEMVPCTARLKLTNTRRVGDALVADATLQVDSFELEVHMLTEHGIVEESED